MIKEWLEEFWKQSLKEREKLENRGARWLERIEEDVRQLGIERWKLKALNREEWAIVLKEARILAGP